MSRRVSRVEEAIKEELSEIIRTEIKDPRIGFVTITEVKVSADLMKAKVYVSVIGDEQEVSDTLEGLDSAHGYMRSLIGRKLRLKYLPEIVFIHEKVAEEALRLDEIMKQQSGEAESAKADEG